MSEISSVKCFAMVGSRGTKLIWFIMLCATRRSFLNFSSAILCWHRTARCIFFRYETLQESTKIDIFRSNGDRNKTFIHRRWRWERKQIVQLVSVSAKRYTAQCLGIVYGLWAHFSFLRPQCSPHAHFDENDDKLQLRLCSAGCIEFFAIRLYKSFEHFAIGAHAPKREIIF